MLLSKVRKQRLTYEELVEAWREGQRRNVARYATSLRKTEAMRFAVAFMEEMDSEDLGRLLAMMEAVNERNRY